MFEGIKVSIIIPCRNEGHYIKQTIESLLRTEVGREQYCEIIVVDDGSVDGCCDFLKKHDSECNRAKVITTSNIGPARARNLGASSSVGNVLIFCDAHIIAPSGWCKKLIETLQNDDIHAVCPGIGHFDPERNVGYGWTLDNKLNIVWLPPCAKISPVPLAPGGCLAVRKSTFYDIGGFDEGFTSYGYEDVELSLRLWLFGYNVYVNPFVIIRHHFRKLAPYDIDIDDFNYNKLRMVICHFNEERIEKTTHLLSNKVNMSVIFNKLIQTRSRQRGINNLSNRKYDDSWFFSKFNIKF